MVRVTIQGADEASCREVDRRLRSASVTFLDRITAEQSSSDALGDTQDAVVFCGANRPDPRRIQQYLAAGKSVLVMADAILLFEHLNQLAETARLSHVQFSVVNPDRFLPSRQLIWQQLASGKLGEAGLVRIHRWESASEVRSLQTDMLPWPMIRDLDLTLWLFGKSPDSVYAVEPQRRGLCSDEPVSTESAARSATLCQIHLGFPGGGMALINYSNQLPAGDGYQSLSVIGSTGAAYADDHQDRQLVFAGGAPQAVRGGEGCALVPVIQQFVDEVRGQHGPAANLSEWNPVRQVAEAAWRSVVSQCAVQLTPTTS